MASKAHRKSKARPSTSKQNVIIKQAAKKMHKKWSKGRSEHVRDALNHDVDLLYNALRSASMAPPTILPTDTDALLAESMHDLGR